MIGVKFNGRLGNQIFQYAFYHYLKSQDKGIYFFVNPHHAYLHKYFDLDPYNSLTLPSKTYSVFTRLLPKVLPFKEVYIENIQVPKPLKGKNLTIYKGFFQTDWYLRNTTCKLELSLKDEYRIQFENAYGQQFRQHKTVVVHVRRTDYLKYGKRDISLPLDYFQRRLETIDRLDDYQVYFVSDDIDAVKAFFKEKDNFIYSSNDEITDFQIIMNADIAIISNSSFAWWAAYLSSKNNVVYAPKNWLGFRIGKEHPKRIMTDKFIWCDVLDNKSI